MKDSSGSLKINIREYAMYIALALIIVVFAILTNGVFTSSRNISNLLDQTAYIAVLAVGMTLVIVIRHIDLSVGFFSGFLGAVAAIAMTSWGLGIWVIIPCIIVMGILGGLLIATPVARLGVPSFVTSLGGWLIYRGLLLMVTGSTGTIMVTNDQFNAIGNGFIPDIAHIQIPGVGHVHLVTIGLGLIAILWFVWSMARNRKSKREYGFLVQRSEIFIAQIVLGVLILALITWVIAGYNGMSWTLAIMLVVVFIFDWVTKNSILGRHIYAVGGNPEAAKLSGINVKKITLIVFGIMGGLAGLSGILYTARLQSASPTGGTLFELDAVAASYIGGVSAAGGVGKVSGALVGALVYMSLMNGMNLLGTDISLQYVIRGAVLVSAVIFDVVSRNSSKIAR